MRPADFDVSKIIETLQGTCTETIQSALDYHYAGMQEDEMLQEDFNAIDNEIFLCEECGWWCEISEQSEDEDSKCRDCCGED